MRLIVNKEMPQLVISNTILNIVIILKGVYIYYYIYDLMKSINPID
jgi:hypothetical protein